MHLYFEVDVCRALGIIINTLQIMRSKVTCYLIKRKVMKMPETNCIVACSFRLVVSYLNLVLYFEGFEKCVLFGEYLNGKRYCCSIFKNCLQNLYFCVGISSLRYSRTF